MRASFRTPLLALALTSTTLATPAALACGPFETRLPTAMAVPYLLAVSSHQAFRTGSEKPIRRTFVLLPDAELQPGPHAVWNRIAADEYDDPMATAASALTNPMEVTLITASGATTVASTKRVFLSDYSTHHKPHLALEVSAPDGARVAILGRTMGTWHAIAPSLPSQADQTWLVNHGFASTDIAKVSVSDVAGTKLVTRTFPTGTDQITTVVANADRIVAQSTGYVLGVVEIAGRLYLVIHPANGDASVLLPIAP